MLYDVELDLNESSKGREQIFKQILLQLSIIEGYKGDLWALFRVSICCPAVLKVFFFIQMVSIDPTGLFEGYSTIVFAPQILVT